MSLRQHCRTLRTAADRYAKCTRDCAVNGRSRANCVNVCEFDVCLCVCVLRDLLEMRTELSRLSLSLQSSCDSTSLHLIKMYRLPAPPSSPARSASSSLGTLTVGELLEATPSEDR